MKKFLIALLLVFVINSIFENAAAEIRLPAILGSHMVLQQKTSTKLWGWSEPGEKITVSTTWDKATYEGRATANARWIIEIKTPAAGGPYSITIKGSNTIVLEDVLIGEVWDCSGQSNMEMNYNWGLKQYAPDVETATNTQIRFFHIPRLTSVYPQDDTRGKWVVCNPEDMKRFSIVGYFFGRTLNENLKVPIGLINASWSGTPAETWTPADSITNNPTLKQGTTLLPYNIGWPITPGYTFNAMINPLTNFAISGVIWYQGEGNMTDPRTYRQLLTTMIRSWRSAWNREFPFYLVQIAPYAGYGNNINSPILREGETQVAQLPNTGMVVIHDLVPDLNDIHPKSKKEVGIRLANLALARTYGLKDSAYLYPMYKGMKVEKEKVMIYFDNAEKGLISKSGALTEFYIAGEDKIFRPATATIKGNTVVVWNKEIKNPVAVRFGFTNTAIPNLFSKEGLPVNIFRTDDWDDVMTVPVK